MSNRPSFDTLFIQIAVLFSKKSTCERASIGAIITRNNRIISCGYIGSPTGLTHCVDGGCIIDPNTGGCIRTLHAESNAIAWAAREGISTKNSTLYTTVSPCLSCAKLIISSGIVRVVYLDTYRDPRSFSFLKEAGIKIEKA